LFNIIFFILRKFIKKLNILKNIIILTILEKGGIIVMRTLLIKILVVILL